MRLLALDQSLNTTGVAVFDNDKILNCGAFTIHSNQELGKRLTEFLYELDDLYETYHLMLSYMKIFNCKWAMSRHTRN